MRALAASFCFPLVINRETLINGEWFDLREELGTGFPWPTGEWMLWEDRIGRQAAWNVPAPQEERGEDRSQPGVEGLECTVLESCAYCILPHPTRRFPTIIGAI